MAASFRERRASMYRSPSPRAVGSRAKRRVLASAAERSVASWRRQQREALRLGVGSTAGVGSRAKRCVLALAASRSAGGPCAASALGPGPARAAASAEPFRQTKGCLGRLCGLAPARGGTASEAGPAGGRPA